MNSNGNEVLLDERRDLRVAIRFGFQPSACASSRGGAEVNQDRFVFRLRLGQSGINVFDPMHCHERLLSQLSERHAIGCSGGEQSRTDSNGLIDPLLDHARQRCTFHRRGSFMLVQKEKRGRTCPASIDSSLAVNRRPWQARGLRRARTTESRP